MVTTHPDALGPNPIQLGTRVQPARRNVQLRSLKEDLLKPEMAKPMVVLRAPNLVAGNEGGRDPVRHYRGPVLEGASGVEGGGEGVVVPQEEGDVRKRLIQSHLEVVDVVVIQDQQLDE